MSGRYSLVVQAAHFIAVLRCNSSISDAESMMSAIFH
jgi:hypothetical protein